MTSIQEKIIKPKLGLLELAKQLGSVSQACKVMGFSRDSFYRFKELYEQGGEQAPVDLISLLRILTDRGTEYCGKVENHAYQLYLAVEDVDHTRTKANSPQTNGIRERFHRTIKDEF